MGVAGRGGRHGGGGVGLGSEIGPSDADRGSGAGGPANALPETATRRPQASAFDLLVDFRDDIGADVLAATPFAEEALGQMTAVDKLYRVRFDNAAEARAAARVPGAKPGCPDGRLGRPGDAAARRGPGARTFDPQRCV